MNYELTIVVTHEQYLLAKQIVEKYEQFEKVKQDEITQRAIAEIDDFLKSRSISGLKIKSVKYFVDGRQITITPELPYFSEFYEDDDADTRIDEIAAKYERVAGWITWVYPK